MFIHRLPMLSHAKHSHADRRHANVQIARSRIERKAHCVVWGERGGSSRGLVAGARENTIVGVTACCGAGVSRGLLWDCSSSRSRCVLDSVCVGLCGHACKVQNPGHGEDIA